MDDLAKVGKSSQTLRPSRKMPPSSQRQPRTRRATAPLRPISQPPTLNPTQWTIWRPDMCTPANVSNADATPDIEGTRGAPAHDKAMAAKFLTALDPSAGRFTFQFFGDGPDRYAEIFHGTLDQAWAKVLVLNGPERRIGAFVTIGETDFKGRREENILRARALFVDADTPEQIASCIQGIEASGATPSIVVETGRGEHFYWLCPDVPRHQFIATQKGLNRNWALMTAITIFRASCGSLVRCTSRMRPNRVL